MRRGVKQGLGCKQEERQDWRQGREIPDPARVDSGSPGSQWGQFEARLVVGVTQTQVQGPWRRPGWTQSMYDTAQTRILMGLQAEGAWAGAQVRLVRATKPCWNSQGPDNIFIFPVTSASGRLCITLLKKWANILMQLNFRKQCFIWTFLQ